MCSRILYCQCMVDTSKYKLMFLAEVNLKSVFTLLCMATIVIISTFPIPVNVAGFRDDPGMVSLFFSSTFI